MKFDFTPVEIVYDLDDEIKAKVYALYEKYQKSKTESSLRELTSYIYNETEDSIYRREFYDLKINEDQTVFDYIMEFDFDLSEKDAEFFSKYEDYTIKCLLKGKFRISEKIHEDIFFKEINGKPLLEHLINNTKFRPYVLTCIQTRTEVIDILKRNNQTRLLQYLGEEILFSKFDEEHTVIEYLIENEMFTYQYLDVIKNHPEIYDVLMKYNKPRYLTCLSSEMLMQERDGRILLDSLLDNGYNIYGVDIINEEMAKLFLKYGLEYKLGSIPFELAFIDVEDSDKKLFEYLTEKDILCYDVVAGSLKYKQNEKEIIDILEKHGKLFMLNNLKEEELLQTYGRDKTLLETLLENNINIIAAQVTKKETFDLLVAYDRYDELCRSSEEMLLQTLPNGKKLYEELILQRKVIETEGINNEEIVDAILNQSDIKLIRCIGTEILLSNINPTETYLDVILNYAKERDRKILGYLRFEDATLNEYAKIIVAHANHGLLGEIRRFDKEKLLEDSQGTTLLEELLREDELLTVTSILDSELRSDIEIATILKLHGIEQGVLSYDEEYKPRYAEKYVRVTLENYSMMPITEEQEMILQELFNIMNDGKTPIEIIEMMVASYRNLYSTNNPYAREVETIIEMKKQHPEFHIEFTTDGACYREDDETIYLEDLNPQLFHHEMGHAFFHLNHQKFIPEEFKGLLIKLNKSPITRLKLENFDNFYRRTRGKVSSRILEKLERLGDAYDIEAVEQYLSSFTDGLEQKLIDRGYSPAVVKRILSQTYTVQEFLSQEKNVAHGELLDKMLRIEHSSIQGLGDMFDGIYKGAYHDGQVTGIISGATLSGYGHGRKYYSQGLEYVYDEMLANFSSMMKMLGPEIAMKKIEQYMGKELAYMIANTYNQMALQNTMSQSINQSQTQYTR